VRAIISGIVLSGLLATGTPPVGPATLARDLSVAHWRTSVAAVAPGRTAPDPAVAAPARVRDLFATLGNAQREALVRLDPTVVGNLDGVPARLRYAANERADPTGSQVPGRLLGYDPRGSGRAIVVLGDLDAARRIAVLVPGSGWHLANLLGPAGRTGNHPLAAAHFLFDEAYRLDPAARVAVVVWLGYDPPAGVDRSERAVTGAAALRRFVAGLPAAAAVTLVCHSYGAVVCGRAAPGLPVSDLVALAAPGLDASTVDDLHSTARVWAARNPDDPIRFVPHVRVAGFGHGADPVDPGFGARVFRTGTAHGHEGYYTPGTESLTNLARILLGMASAVTRADAV
jgi:Alpha/beta hydrolase